MTSEYNVIPFPGKKLTSFDFFPWDDVRHYPNIVIHFGTNDNSSGVQHSHYESSLYMVIIVVRSILN